MTSENAALRITGLRFRYGGGQGAAPMSEGWTIDIPSLEVARGEQVLLTGGSGSGKSTLLHLIAGLIEPSQGEVVVAGQRVHGLHGGRRDRFRGEHIGMIFQTFNLLHGFSVVENVMAALMFGSKPPAQHKRLALDLLEQLGIKRVDAMPEQLSVGQQQRVAVARAIACEPALVLADEPTASLDFENSAASMDLIQSVCRSHNAALLCASHDRAMEPRFARKISLSGAAALAM